MSVIVLKWWLDNLRVFNGKCLILPKAQVKGCQVSLCEGMGANCVGVDTGGKWSGTTVLNSLQ